MRQAALLTVVLVAVTTGAGLLLTQPSASQSSQESAVLKVAKAGRTAVLKDRPGSLCRLLTRRARRNSLLRNNYDTPRKEQKRPGPRTCEKAIGFLIHEIRDGDRTYREVKRQPTLASFEVVRITGKRAHLRLVIVTKPAGETEIDIYFLRGRSGWRADFANFSPFDRSSGE